MGRKKERRWLASKESRLDGYLDDTFEMHLDRETFFLTDAMDTWRILHSVNCGHQTDRIRKR